MELSSPPGGIVIDELHAPPKDRTRNYTNSKTGNYFLATELARRAGSSNIVSVSINPGAATTNLFRHTPYLNYLAYPLLYKPELAALTELYAGFSPEIGVQNNGCYVIPWGRISNSLRDDLINATKTAEEGGSGKAQEFWEFCLEKTKDYM